MSETHVITTRIDIVENQRYYNLPNDLIKILDVRCKNHLNRNDEYRTLPRMIGEPITEDADGQ